MAIEQAAKSGAKTRGEEAAERRKACGVWLKGLREAAGLTQIQLAKTLGYDYYTIVSQIEVGRARVPAEDLGRWADVLGVGRADFAAGVMRHYNPEYFEALFGEDAANDAR